MALKLRYFLPALFALCACQGEPPEVHAAERTRVHALELLADPPRPADPQIKRTHRLLPGPDLLFHASRGEARLRTEADEAGKVSHTLDLAGPASLEVHFPVQLSGADFNAVAVDIECTEEREFTLDFEIDGKRVDRMRGMAMSRSVRGEDLDPRQHLHFQMPALYRWPERITRLILRCSTRTEGLRLHGIDFLRSPLDLHLPSPTRGAELILVGSEERRGVGLSPSFGVASQWQVSPGSVLRFSYAAPGAGLTGQPIAEEGTGLLLSVQGSNGEAWSRRYTPTGSDRYRWFDVRVPLDAFTGQTVNIHWKVIANTEDPWALAEVGVIEGRGPAPKVVLITSDTHRADHLGAAPDTTGVRTPQLDALADRGVLFEDCFASTNITNPSHIALMTATHPRDVGVFSNNEPISDLAPTLAEAFQRAGFATMAALSIKHLGSRTSGLGQGFERLSAPRFGNKRDGSKAVADVLQWSEENGDVPLFLWVHLYDAHTPYLPPKHLLESYYDRDPALAFDPDAPEPEGVPSHVYEKLYPGLKDLAYPKALYAGEITHVDYRLTDLFDHPSLIHAVFAFTSDHGESLGQHGIYFAHADLYPDDLRVPLILSYPGGPRGARVRAPVSQLDLGRTLLDLGGAYAVEFPGENLLVNSAIEVSVSGDLSSSSPSAPVIPSDSPPRFAMGAGHIMASITRDDWHLILALKKVAGHHRVTPRPRHEVSLYHLGRDPQANENLLDTEFEKARELRAELIQWLRAAEDRGWRGTQVVDSATLQALESLGYTASRSQGTGPVEYFPEDCTCPWCERF